MTEPSNEERFIVAGQVGVSWKVFDTQKVVPPILFGDYGDADNNWHGATVVANELNGLAATLLREAERYMDALVAIKHGGDPWSEQIARKALENE